MAKIVRKLWTLSSDTPIGQRLYIERLCKRTWKTTFEQNRSFPGPTQKKKKIETGSTGVGANGSLVVVERGDDR